MLTARKSFTERQQDYVNSVISHFTFSFDVDELEKQVKQLKEALTNPDVSQANSFYWLSECLANPEKYLQELVLNNDEKCTIHDIKKYILESIHARLTGAARTANISYKKLRWNYGQIIAATIKEDDKTTWFKRKPARVDGGDNPWQLPTILGKIYTRAIREAIDDRLPEIPEKQIWIDVDASIDGENSSDELFVTNAPFFPENDEGRIAEHQFMMSTQITAERLALKFAANFALSRLDEFDLHKEKALIQPATMQIITHQFYNTLLEKKLIRLNYFLDSTEQQAINFTDDILLELLKLDLCNYAQMKSMTEAQRKVAIHPVYNAMLHNKTLKMEKIRQLSDRRSQFLIHPFVSNLIQLGKITFEQAVNLPSHLFSLFTNRLYCEYLKKNLVYAAFLKLEHYHAELMLNPVFASLVTSKQISLDMITSLSKDMTEHSKCFPYVIDWIKLGVIPFENFQKCKDGNDLTKLYIEAYAKRLHAIFNNVPFCINKTADNIELIKEELFFTANNIQLKIGIFQEWILYTFIIKLGNNLRLENTNSPNYLYTQMLSIIFPSKERNVSWITILEDLISLAESQQNKNGTVNLFADSFNSPKGRFNKKHKNHDDLEKNIANLCSRLISIRSIILSTEKTVSYRSYP